MLPNVSTRAWEKKNLLQSGPRDPSLIIAITGCHPGGRGGGGGGGGGEDMEQLVVDPLESISLAEPHKSTYVSSLLSNAKKEQIQ